MKILVTGASGFIGRYLVEFLARDGHEVTGTYLRRPELASRLPLPRGVTWAALNIQHGPKVRSLVERLRPEAVFHLAAQAYAGQSWKDPADTFSTNVLGTIHLYEALRRRPPSAGILLAASASAYGSDQTMPIGEEAPFHPINPYGVSKASQELISYQYAHNFGLRIVRARLFITTGPGKRGDALNDFAQQIVRVERSGRAGELRVGNLDTRRDISDVRDVVRAVWKVFVAGTPDEPVNVGRGEASSIRGIVDQLCREARVPISVVTEPARLRPSDEPIIQADVRRLQALGYAPEVALATTIHDALGYWRGEGAGRRTEPNRNRPRSDPARSGRARRSPLRRSAKRRPWSVAGPAAS